MTTKRVNNFLTMTIVALNVATLLNFSFYKLYAGAIIYVNLLFCGLQLFMLRFRLAKAELLLLTGIFCYCVLTFLINNNSLGAVAAYSLIFLIAICFKHQKIWIGNLKILQPILLLILCFIFLKARTIVVDGKLDLSGINPNTYGLMAELVLIWFSFLCSVIPFFRKHAQIQILMFMFTFYIEYRLECRTGMITVLLWGFLTYVIPGVFQMQGKKIILLFVAAIGGGIIFPFCYVKLSTNEALSIAIHELTGKYAFTGREFIWGRLLSEWTKDPLNFLFGLGSHSEEIFGQGFSMHNSYMQIVLNFGFLGIAFFVAFVALQIHICYHNQSIIDNWRTRLLCGYFVILIASYTEVYLQTDQTVLLVGMLLGLAANPNIRAITNSVAQNNLS